jgi:hypothetical protein
MGRTEGDNCIEPAMLERMGRIARVLPGHLVSVDRGDTPEPSDVFEADYEPPPDSGVVLRIDGIMAEELVDRLG